ncbi:DNA-directed RNA polymerase subunit beta [Bacillus massilinigeriensis]|uniref:DNA-directed RNA polymerase subunit beta n=1 Tax=Bacillus massilionigeriensis TaxID=1805475 RepID=UPI00096AFEF6|nr:DNA-directed RNA polymerase subunit beta [Bacillus massilionigeriensis]
MSVNNNSHEASVTREQVKMEREHNRDRENQTEKLSERRKRIRVRLIPVWLRVVIVAIMIVFAVMIGAIFGYSVLGDGKAGDVFQKSTWTHMVDLVKKEK